MTPDRLLGLVTAEFLKLQSRTTARAGWVALALLGLVVPLFLAFLGSSGVTVNGGDLGANLDLSAANGARWALIVRNFYVAQAFLIVLGALSVAGELQARTLREDLVRPVPRWAVLGAKWVALSLWSAIALAMQWGVAVLVGLVLLDLQGEAEFVDVLLGYVASWVADTGFLTAVLLISAAARSVAATIAGMFLFLILERFVGWGLWMVRGIRVGMPPEWGEQIPWFVDILLDASPWLPSSAWNVWKELVDGVDPSWQGWASLGILTLLAAALAERIFARVDVP